MTRNLTGRRSEYRRILCPTDFSALARVGVDEAARLAARDGAELVLLHVLPSVASYAAVEIPGTVLLRFVDQWREEAQGTLYRIRDQLRQTGVVTHALMVEGNAAEEIVRVAERLRCDLIVLATGGGNSFIRGILGRSMAERVIRRARCPVLAYCSSQPSSAHKRARATQKVAA